MLHIKGKDLEPGILIFFFFVTAPQVTWFNFHFPLNKVIHYYRHFSFILLDTTVRWIDFLKFSPFQVLQFYETRQFI